MNKKTLIIYHKDLDGYTAALSYVFNDSGYIKDHINFNNKLPTYKELCENYDFFFIDYNNDNLLMKLEKLNYNLDNYDKLVLLDFSCELEIMNILKNKFKDNFIWIDHHKNIYEEYEKKITIKGLRDNNNAACVLVWKYFNQNHPLYVDYIEDMDLWLWKQNYSKEILSALELLFNNLINIDHNYFISLFNNSDFINHKTNLIMQGETIIKYRSVEINRDISNGKIIDFENYKTFIINSLLKPGFISETIFNDYKYNNIEIVLVWYRSHKLNLDKVSIRSKNNNCNCAEIAQKYNGNGHQKAAGFIIDHINKLY